MEGILSQEEIDALLGGGDSAGTEPEPKESNFEKKIHLTQDEKDVIGEVGNISLGSSSTALSTLLGKNVSITTPKVEVWNLEELKSKLAGEEKVVIQIEYKSGFSGLNMLIMESKNALIIGDLMMGNDGSNPPDKLEDLYLSAVVESMNQMMGSSATSLAGMFKKEIDINPPSVSVSNIDEINSKTDFFNKNNEFVIVIFDMKIEGLIDTNIYQILSAEFAREMVSEMHKMSGEEEEPQQPQPQMQQQTIQQNPQMQQPQINQNMGMQMPPNMGWQQPQMQNMGMPQQPQMMGGYQNFQQPVNVQPVQFASFGNSIQQEMPSNIDLIMDVPLQVTVELGRTKMQIKEILDLGPGSIVELDKLAGEPLNILVNGKLIAKGEVVVIDESFGVRVIDIVSKMERLNKVQ
ncbi:flagellar motor switch phosphatase FliY [Haliovirga abyssi]|uniref:Flagellar motor switch phosphatase FliY n=1 Tax=Haliovirga abyssi TaxID=2996794 RepID=A0AAU9DVF6_9FUSO|nr:flagellar motor switch phosphatase FliY [Haliovirga abyssi]BDU50116.1 flagellar motor switch phosphatase FliY [Haliovirga abyssi]